MSMVREEDNDEKSDHAGDGNDGDPPQLEPESSEPSSKRPKPSS